MQYLLLVRHTNGTLECMVIHPINGLPIPLADNIIKHGRVCGCLDNFRLYSNICVDVSACPNKTFDGEQKISLLPFKFTNVYVSPFRLAIDSLTAVCTLRGLP